MLERSAGKLARCVLRGGGGGNTAFLPECIETIVYLPDYSGAIDKHFSMYKGENKKLYRIASTPSPKTMQTIAMLRVSRDSQDVKNQRLALLEFAQKEQLVISEFMELNRDRWEHRCKKIRLWGVIRL